MAAVFLVVSIFGALAAPPPQAFVTTWKTDNTGSSSNTQITIPTGGATGFNYDVLWFEVSTPSNTGTLLGQTGDLTIDFGSPGIYQVEITGDFQRINFGFGFNDAQKLLTVEQWGNLTWSTMEMAFNGCSNLRIPATDAPDLSNVTTMLGMFLGCSSFNDPINHWDVSTVTIMDQLFSGASAFDQDLSSWNVKNVASSYYMFGSASAFNHDISGWEMSSAVMGGMFANASSFNQDISGWDVSNGSSLFSMFEGATSFNQDISTWDVSNIIGLDNMFSGAASFDQNLGSWNITNVGNLTNMFSNSGMSRQSYDSTLIGWQALPFLQSGVTFGVDGLEYCNANSERAALVAMYGWNFVGDVFDCSVLPFVTRWKTDNAGDSGPTQVLIPVPSNPIGFNYDVSWEEVGNSANSGSATNLTGAYTIEFGTAGTYEVSISGTFPQFTFQGGTGDHDKLLSVEQWGGNPWVSMNGLFRGAKNLVINATDAPDLSSVVDFSSAFQGCEQMNADLSGWDMSNAINVTAMFFSASNFNQDLSSWDVSNVTDMSELFFLATSFDGDLSTWQVQNVTDMSFMFGGASSFNQDLSAWDPDTVQTMQSMFAGAASFNQPLNSWDVQSVKNMNEMFSGASSFNQDLDTWNTSGVTDMQRMFRQASTFNGDISTWQTQNVLDMSYMFSQATVFNGNISNWNVSSVTTMASMFENATAFNQDINGWTVDDVQDMSRMFYQADVFNLPIDQWKVNSVTTMNQMFALNDAFNQDLSTWDVGNVSDFQSMFLFATAFDQDLGSWDMGMANNLTNMFSSSALTSDHYDQILIGWGGQTGLNSGLDLGTVPSTYCAGEAARNVLVGTYIWTINDDGLACPEANLVSVYPPQNALNVARNTEIGMKFSADMDFTTFNSNTVVVSGSLSGLLSGFFTIGTSDSAVFILDEQLKAGEVVSVTITDQLYTDSAIQIDTTFTWQFIAAVDGGNNHFSQSTGSLGTHQSQGLALGDINGDGFIDAYVSNDGATGVDINKVYLNDGTGAFVATSQSLSDNNGRKVAFVDMNNDGFLDILETNTSGATNNLWINDGTGTFNQDAQSLGTSGNAVEAGDFNGDGYHDPIVAFDGNDQLYLNSSALVLSNSGGVFSSQNSNDVGIGDFDNDGDLDLVLADEGSGNSVWLNNGAGVFTFSGSLSAASTQAVAVGDLNGDGNLDLYFANDDANDELFFGVGNGTFNQSPQTLSGLLNREVALGDLDGDGDLDVILVNDAAAVLNSVWLNDGAGNMVELSGLVFGDGVSTRDVKVADIDGDGDLDILTVTGAGQTINEIWKNEPEPCDPTLITSESDANVCGTLRAGIQFANVNSGVDTLKVSLSGTQIDLASQLDQITEQVVILSADGFPINLNGNGLDTGLAFVVGSDNSVVSDFHLMNFNSVGIYMLETGSVKVSNCFVGLDPQTNSPEVFSGTGIFCERSFNPIIGGINSGERNYISSCDGAGIKLLICSGAEIYNNYVGTDSSGFVAYPNQVGIVLDSVYAGGTYNEIGNDSLPGSGNLISGNSQQGVLVQKSSVNVRINRNLIGVDATGNAALSNGSGIEMIDVTECYVGGPTSDNHNIVSGHGSGPGIYFENATQVYVRGNYIGLNKNGDAVIPNGVGIHLNSSYQSDIGDFDPNNGNRISGNSNEGVLVENSSYNIQFYNNVIGGDTSQSTAFGNGSYGIRLNNDVDAMFIEEKNQIGYNGGAGVFIEDVNSEFNYLSNNLIFCNGGKGIEIIPGGNTNAVAPTITGVTSTGITATGVGASQTVEFFYADANCQNNEGEDYIGDAVITGGVATYSGPIDTTKFIVATVRDADRNTSEFSEPFGPACNPLIVTTVVDDTVCGTLRYAMMYADGNIGPDTITFTIANDTIRLDSSLNLQVDSGTIIDGGTNNIVLMPSNSFDLNEDMVRINVPNTVIQNLDLYGTIEGNHVKSGIEFESFAHYSRVENSSIHGFIDAGVIIKGGQVGAELTSLVVYDNEDAGLFIESGVDSVQVKSSFIGINESKVPFGVQKNGIICGSRNAIIGGETTFDANIIGGNTQVGLLIADTNGKVFNNYIGVDTDGTTPIPNGLSGIAVGGSNNVIGDSALALGNTIAFNGAHGIWLTPDADSVLIHHNIIFSNDSLGIKFEGMSVPIIQTTSVDEVTGTASGDAYIQVYGASDGEGDLLLGTTTSLADGTWTYNLTAGNISQLMANGLDSVTALQDSSSMTSAFSDAVYIDLQSICLDPLEVTSTDDDMVCGTLRNAIDYANNNPGKDTITFNILGTGPHVINVIDSSYVVTDPVVIDGYSQPGTTLNSADESFDADIMINLDGSNQVVKGDGIRFTADSNEVRGLRIILFQNNGSAALNFDQSNANRVVGNMIGLDVDHTDPSRNYYGIYLNESSDNQIGDTSNADRNIIVWCDYSGIFSNASHNNNIVNNYIGMGPGIFSGYGNNVDGISLENGSSFASIRNNVICDNDSAGIYIDATSHDHTITSNTIGLNYENQIIYSNMTYGGLAIWGHHNHIGDGTFAGSNIIAGNEDAEIYLAGKHNDFQFNYIGTVRDSSFIDHGVDGVKLIAGADSNSFYRNVVAHNNNGIWAESSSVQGNRYHGNSFFNNAVAILHETGAQLDAQPPVIDSTAFLLTDLDYVIFYGHGIQESLIQLYVDSVDQGQEFVDSVRVNSSGQWEIWVLRTTIDEYTAAGLTKFTALQDVTDNTSPFSLAITIDYSMSPVITNVTYTITGDSVIVSWNDDTSRTGETYTINYGTSASLLNPVDSVKNDTSIAIGYTNGIEQYISVTVTDSATGNSVTSAIIALPYITAPVFSGSSFCVSDSLAISLSGFGLNMSTQSFTVYIIDSASVIVDSISLPSNSETFEYELSSLETDKSYSIQVLGNESQIYSGISSPFSVTDAGGDLITLLDDEFNVVTHNKRKINVSTLLANDDFGLAVLIGVGGAQFGTVTLDGGVVTYQSNSRYTGVDFFTYTVGGGCYVNDTATVKLNVSYLEQNNDPVGNSNTTSVTVSVDVTQLTDPDTVFIVYGPTSGSPLVFNFSNFSFTIDYNGSDFYGYDTIVYEVCAGPDCFQGLKIVQRDSVSGPLLVEFDEKQIQVSVFNAVSPNQDGVHDYLDMEFTYEDGTVVKITDKSIQVRIFNMWGDNIYVEDNYDVEDPEHRWSGQSLVTGDAPSGTYYYSMEIEYTNEKGKRKFFKHPGFVVLKRD